MVVAVPVSRYVLQYDTEWKRPTEPTSRYNVPPGRDSALISHSVYGVLVVPQHTGKYLERSLLPISMEEDVLNDK